MIVVLSGRLSFMVQIVVMYVCLCPLSFFCAPPGNFPICGVSVRGVLGAWSRGFLDVVVP